MRWSAKPVSAPTSTTNDRHVSLLSTLRFITSHPLNRAHKSAAIGRFVRWQLAARLLPYPVVVPFVDDLVLMMERGMTGASGNFYCGLHEPHEMGFVLHLMRQGDVFYDVGANIGSYSLLAAAAGASRIHAFEPVHSTSIRLARNVAINALGARVSIHECALGACEGDVAMTRDEDTTNHVAVETTAGSVATVPLRQFDTFYVQGTPSFIKIDVEGYEEQVVKGAEAALSDPALMGVLMEDDGYGKRYDSKWDAASFMRERGFSPWTYNAFERSLKPGRASGPDSRNCLFLRDDERALKRVQSAPKFKLNHASL